MMMMMMTMMMMQENRLDRPTEYSVIVVHRHFADNGAYGVSPDLATNLPALAAKCMQVKGLRYRSVWEAWCPKESPFETEILRHSILRKRTRVSLLQVENAAPLTPRS